jgi:hypothetical protein
VPVVRETWGAGAEDRREEPARCAQAVGPLALPTARILREEDDWVKRGPRGSVTVRGARPEADRSGPPVGTPAGHLSHARAVRASEVGPKRAGKGVGLKRKSQPE